MSLDNRQSVKVCSLEKGAFVGEEILYKKSESYSYTIIVSSKSANFIVINKEKFVSRFSHKT